MWRSTCFSDGLGPLFSHSLTGFKKCFEGKQVCYTHEGIVFIICPDHYTIQLYLAKNVLCNSHPKTGSVYMGKNRYMLLPLKDSIILMFSLQFKVFYGQCFFFLFKVLFSLK